MHENQSVYAKNGKRVKNNTFNSLEHKINFSCFYQLQTSCRSNKVQEKTFVLSKILLKLLSLPEGTVTASIDKFINARTITRRN